MTRESGSGKDKRRERIKERLLARWNESEGDSTEFPARAEAAFSAAALIGNYRAIGAQVKSHALLPMIKANAYGHGAAWAAKTLAREESLYGFGVASLEEGREVREALGLKGRKTRVLAFSGAANWSDGKGNYCAAHGLTPVLASEEDLRAFVKAKWPARLPYHLKFNTGMNRLGIAPSSLGPTIALLRKLPAEELPEGVASHLAVAEDPKHALTRLQFERFREIRAGFENLGSAIQFHIANSSAIWNAKHYGLEGLTDVARPGLSLYGVAPWPDAPARGIEAVMSLRYQVVQRRRLRQGESIGYGATYRHKDETPLEVAILSSGYADGFHRRNSGVGHLFLGGRSRRILGIVSMDLSAVECDASTKVGEYAEMVGPGIDPWTQAGASGTIPYELLTSVSPRIRRRYE